MNTGSLIRVTVVLGTSLDESEIENHLDSEGRYLVSRLRANEIATSNQIMTSDVIIVEIEEMGEDELQIFSEVKAKAPDLPIVLLSQELEHGSMQKLLKFNVQDWLLRPVEKQPLKNSIQSMVRSTRNTSNMVHAVISSVGGAGATTLAISMADIASRYFAKKETDVALVDLDFSTGDCGYVLNMANAFNLGSSSSAHRRIDAEFIRFIQQKHEAGFFLYSFKRPDVNTEMNGQELILRLLDAISMEHSVLFLDLPYYATEWRADVLAGVNTCTLVCEVNLPAIKHALDLIREIRSIRGEDFPINVLFNKHVKKMFGQRIPKRRIEELLDGTPFDFIPVDTSVVGEAVDRGVLPSTIAARSPMLKKLNAYMKSQGMLKVAEK